MSLLCCLIFCLFISLVRHVTNFLMKFHDTVDDRIEKLNNRRYRLTNMFASRFAHSTVQRN